MVRIVVVRVDRCPARVRLRLARAPAAALTARARAHLITSPPRRRSPHREAIHPTATRTWSPRSHHVALTVALAVARTRRPPSPARAPQDRHMPALSRSSTHASATCVALQAQRRGLLRRPPDESRGRCSHTMRWRRAYHRGPRTARPSRVRQAPAHAAKTPGRASRRGRA